MQSVVAVKATRSTLAEEHRANYMKEVKIMGNMMHPNIVKLFGLVREGECGLLESIAP